MCLDDDHSYIARFVDFLPLMLLISIGGNRRWLRQTHCYAPDVKLFIDRKIWGTTQEHACARFFFSLTFSH